MKNHFLIIMVCVLGVITHCSAQEANGRFDEWGKVTVDELKMTECSFEKNADAMLLLDLGEVFYKGMS